MLRSPKTPLDTRELYRGKGGEMHLDAISLQARVLKEWLTLDRAKARQMFEGLAHPVLDARPCEDPFVADIAPYYEIAAAIAQSAFSDEEKKHDAQAQFLVALLAGARSSNELAAFVSVIDNVALTHAQSEQVIGAFSAKLSLNECGLSIAGHELQHARQWSCGSWPDFRSRESHRGSACLTNLPKISWSRS